MAQQELASLVVSLEANIAKFTSDMGRAALLAERAFNDMQKSAKQLDDRIAGVTRSVVGFAAAYVSVQQMTAAFRQSVDEMDQMVKMSQKFGVATDALQRLAYAAKLSDVSLDALGTAMKKLAVGIAEATAGGKTQQAMFDALGVSFKNADGSARSVDDVLGDLADKFGKTEDSAEKTGWAVALFGKSGQDMIPMLNAGKQGLADLGDEAQRFGAVIRKDLLDASEKFNDNLDRISTLLRGQFNQAVTGMTPQLNLLADAFIKVVTEGKKMSTDLMIKRDADVIVLGLAALADVAIKAAQGFAVLAQSAITAAKGYQLLIRTFAEGNPVSAAKSLLSGQSIFSDATKRLADEASVSVKDLQTVNKAFFSDWFAVTKNVRDAMAQRDQQTNFGAGKAPKAAEPPKGKLPPPVAATGETAAEKEARAAIKAMVDGRIQAAEQGLARERDVWTANEQYLQRLRGAELIDARTFGEAMTRQREITLDRTLATYDDEIAALQDLKKQKGIQASQVIDIDNKIAAVESKKKQAVIDAAQAQSNAQIDELSLWAKAGVAMDDYYRRLDLSMAAERAQVDMIGMNTAAVAGLVAEMRVLADVEAQIRQLRKTSTLSPDEFNQKADQLRAEGTVRAIQAGANATVNASDAAYRNLLVSMDEYEIRVRHDIGWQQSQLDMTGKTALEIEKLNSAKRIQLDIDEQIRQAQKGSATPIDPEPFRQRGQQLIDDSNAASDRRAKQLRDPWLGAQAAVIAYGEEASKTGVMVGQVWANAMQNAEDAFVNFVKTGKLSFKDLANAIILDIIRIQARQAAAGVASWIFNVGTAMFTGNPAAAVAGATGGGYGRFYEQARGGAWIGGVQRFAAGGVVNGPTLFNHRSGLGLMGEAGPEAIMPLKRGAGGRLGVVAQVGNTAAPSVTVANTYNIDSRSDRAQIMQMIEEGGRRTAAMIAQQVARGSLAYTRPS